MLSEDLILELGGLIRRLERNVRETPSFARMSNPEGLTLDAIEDAIVGLIIMHINLRIGQG